MDIHLRHLLFPEDMFHKISDSFPQRKIQLPRFLPVGVPRTDPELQLQQQITVFFKT